MLVFTRGISLGIWEQVGMLEREVELYKRLLPRLAGISFLTYGDAGESRYQEKVGKIDIISNDRSYPKTKFSILAPIIYRAHFRNADIIKTNQLDGAWTAIIAKILYRKKVIVRCGYLWSVFQKNGLRGRFQVMGSSLLEKLCLKFADICVVAAQRDAEYIKKRHKISPARIKVIPNFVDTSLFRPMENIEREKGLVCFVGRLSPQKNVEMLFEAANRLENVKLLIIGDGELRDKLKEMAQQLHLDVEFHQSVPNSQLPVYLNRAQAFVLPSHYEGCPKTLLEAMSCGLPVIGTDVEGIREIIRNGENGILCEKSVDGIAGAIERFLSGNSSATQMAKKAREYVTENHSLDRIVEAECEIIRNVCAIHG
jgi:glycosyltransferase involved in cell wall biosynthesis